MYTESITIGILYTLTISVIEGEVYHRFWLHRIKYDNKWDKPLLVANRISVLLAVWFLSTPGMAIGMALCFPFVHDGIYYVYRNWRHKGLYQDGWFAHSGEDTSKVSLDPIWRSVLFVAGIVVIFLFA